ncbi:DUF2851 family protein [Mangrovivirga cuniculi]|uniref:DUF2851 domain-containing protein n=1 Tax=Mangrovivirga cuniculi TaxID=2715131 RepID=A0A4D7K5S4_9BACT|nr:DUF2851 family protein [Mangrovivirga cuniculi]QCK14738.1 DUF2851 domain-containing protein [Mangrovivirga cuniculi]
MQEDFLHYLWKYQSFDKDELTTHRNQPLAIIKSGTFNNNDGPDFNRGLVEIDDLKWFGNIEIHIKSSDWYNHKHHEDPAYDNVILHVVWENDVDVFNAAGEIIPVLELKDRVSPLLVRKYKQFLQPPGSIPCGVFDPVNNCDTVRIRQALDMAMIQRMDEKKLRILNELSDENNNWEKVAYKQLLRSFGFKINQDGFDQMAYLLDETIIRKNYHRPVVIEAYLYGLAGMLDGEPCDDYSALLKSEFDFLRHKYNLNQKVDPSYWKYMRLRPSNFPAVRIAQYCAIISENKNLFDAFLNFDSYLSIQKILKKEPSEYWKNHYKFGTESKSKSKTPGKASIDLLVINTIVPLIYTYAEYIGDIELKEKALLILESIKPEKNRITKRFSDLGFDLINAYDSQSVIGLNKMFCERKKCLSCPVGINLLKNNHASGVQTP